MPCGLIGSDIWFNYNATFTGAIDIDTCGSTFDTVLAVYDGCDCPANPANLLACNDDCGGVPCPPLQSCVKVQVVAGQCYKIQVGGFAGQQGVGVINITKQEPDGDEGCTPGYWKQPHHFDSWTAPFDPDDSFSDHFDNAFPGQTLLDVLKQGGGGLNALGRHTVAALLNAASPDVAFCVTADEVIQMFNDVWPGTNTDYQALKDFFEECNEAGCPLNGNSDLNGDGLVGIEDFLMLLSQWGTDGSGDIDGDGIVGVLDLLILLTWWGS